MRLRAQRQSPLRHYYEAYTNNNPRRFRFRFSLGAMLVLVTAVCCYLGWQTHIVRQRRAVLAEVIARGSFSVTTAAQWKAQFPHGPPPGLPVESPATIPAVRRWLGDEAIQTIYYMAFMEAYSDADLKRLQKHFPEAHFLESQPEPCHPGCFPHGTLVETPQGPRPIETISVGDELIVFAEQDPTRALPTTSRVSSIFRTSNRLWQIETPDANLLTTEIQPLCLSDGRLRPAGKIEVGKSVYRYLDGRVRAVEVLAVQPTDRAEPVINLVFENAEVFAAGGFLARSKPPAESGEINHLTSEP